MALKNTIQAVQKNFPINFLLATMKTPSKYRCGARKQ
jgi:hypothetical protein